MPQLSLDDVRKAILAAGVKNLKEFGYKVGVDEETILTDLVFRKFFRRMLTDDENRPRGPYADLIRQVHTELLAKIDAEEAKDAEQEKAKPAKRAKSKKK